MKKYSTITDYINWVKCQYIPQHKIAYLEYGDPLNKNVIVCAHGLTRNAYDFNKIANALKAEFRIISITYPGRGDSDYFANKTHYNYYVYLKDTLFILESLKIERPIWLGTSMGGIIGMVLASRYKNVLKGLILNDIGPFIPAETLVKIRTYASKTVLFNDFDSAKDHLKVIYNQFGINDESDWNYITTNSFYKNEDGKYQMCYDPAIIQGVKSVMKKQQDVNIWYIWKKIICPMLVIHGVDSKILQSDTIKKMQKIKHFDLYEVQNVGHAPALMANDQIRTISLWIKKLFN